MSMVKRSNKRKFFLCTLLTVFLSFGILGGCSSSGGNGNSSQNNSSFKFTDVTNQSGLSYTHSFITGGPVGEPQLISGGVAAGDYNNDGWIDLYVVKGNANSNSLYRNNGDGTFIDVGASAGVALESVSSGPAFADFTGDGFLDLFVGSIFPHKVSVFVNNGNGTFSNITATASDTAVDKQNTFSATFGDYDMDNDLDLLMTHWGSGTVGGSSQHLWRNNGDSTFTDVSTEAGLTAAYQGTSDFTFTPNFADINNDRYLDILMAGDFGTSKVFINQKDGTFLNTTDTNIITDENGMGAAAGDYDNDGDVDWFVSSIYDPDRIPNGNWGITGNRLYQNKGDGTFSDVTIQAGVEHGFWGWGSCFADFDNDGNLDIVHLNGFGFRPDGSAAEYFEDPSRLFMSNGNGTFTESASKRGLNDTGQGRGLVCFDYDKDGDVDLFIFNNNQPGKLYRNDGGNSNNFLNVQLNGLPPNTKGIGARVTITAGTSVQMRDISTGNNFVSQNPSYAHFGLAETENVDEVQILWPDGLISILTNVAPNQFLTIDHPDL